MSNIREVARIAGVSVATVSRTLSHPDKVSEASKKKVMEAIEQVKYRPNMLARNFRSARAYSLVVLVPDIANPFFALVIRSIEQQAQKKGYSVLLGDTQDSHAREQDYIRLVETRLADGVIQLRPQWDQTSDQQSMNFPYLHLCATESTPGPCIRVDNVAAFKNIVDYLISLGHRRIGLITGLKGNPHTIDRLKGYKQALSEAGIPFDETLIAEGEFLIWSGVNAANTLCKLPNRPTAIACMNDEMAIGAIQAIKSHDLKVPGDISVTGFDDISYSRYCDPPLTTISQPADDMGSIAVDILLRLIEGETLDEEEHVLPYDFIVRKSTSVCKAADTNSDISQEPN
ncbi:LacI family DNA-binding transcriptional regulator [Teredinibacter waterburyi]|jgi:transcriptional regulator, LacI family|uniref:LacI family DNA-binding transcriptional regulator n=1 Tax=Teredinibacter waterburyi TaxID=1500538 RepID=UPI00165F95C1|nr:LacI family DNA-binding transcriptional regulator [Teredinibacter waterburyi]